MRFAYSKQLSPPGLLLPVLFRPFGSVDAIAVEAKIDTGADMTVIPVEFKDRLKLKAHALRKCKGALDVEYVSVPVVAVECSFGTLEFFALEVLATERSTVLLGRDLLNNVILIANGPQQFFEIRT